MLVDRWDLLWMKTAMAVGVDDGRLAACDVATLDGADDQTVRIRTSSTGSTWFGQWNLCE